MTIAIPASRSNINKLPSSPVEPSLHRGLTDASLKRLGVDYIDLYYQHRVDPETPIEDTVGTMPI